MKKSMKALSVLLAMALLSFFLGCPQSSGGTPVNPETPSSTVISGIYSEGDSFYINVDADNGPSSGNGAW